MQCVVRWGCILIGEADVPCPFHVSRAPLAVDEAPGSVYPYSRPLVPEDGAGDGRTWPVSGALRVPLDNLTM